MLAITALLDAVGQFLPQYVGTLPYAPRAYEVPLLVYSALMFATLLDVSFEAIRRTASVAMPSSTAAEKL